MRTTLMALSMVATVGTAAAEVTVSIPLSINAIDSIISQTYSCGDGDAFSVQYVNAGANVLAILPVDGERRIFVNVVSASGAMWFQHLAHGTLLARTSGGPRATAPHWKTS